VKGGPSTEGNSEAPPVRKCFVFSQYRKPFVYHLADFSGNLSVTWTLMNIQFTEKERSEICFFYGYLDGNSKAAVKKSGSVFPTAAKQSQQTLAGHMRGCEL
jgi:hypothetical protein